MTFWTDLVDAAVVGTGRAAPPSPPPSLAGLPVGSGRVGPDGPGLLRLAAVASRARRACYMPPVSTDAAPEEAPPDHRPAVPVAARTRLAGLLADERIELVTEWLRLLARTGRQPPEALLPPLLWNAADNQPLRDALVPVLGPLAAWLAAANPRWAWAITAGPAGPSDPGTWTTGAWTTGSHRTRREILDQVRRTDPAAGRDLVAATWPDDSARDRAAFIAGLAVGLDPGDEPLLDQALADSRGEVRQAAADLLAKLPGSAFSRRAVARAAAAVQVREAGVRRGSSPRASTRRLIVTPPAEATPEMIADGIGGRPPRGTGLSAWLLRQVTAAVPAAWWTGHAGLPPAGLLAIAEAPWAADLEAGWTEAAMRDADVPWLTALLAQPKRQADEMGTALLKALPDADRDSWLAANPQSPLFAAIELASVPWSASLSSAVRDRILAFAGAGDDTGRRDHRGPTATQAQVNRLLRVAAARLEPPVMPDLDPARVPLGLANGWARMMNTLSDRAAMRRELGA